MPNERISSNFGTIFICYPINSKTTEPIFTIFLHDLEQLVELFLRIAPSMRRPGSFNILEPKRVYILNIISIDSAVFAHGSRSCPTHGDTHVSLLSCVMPQWTNVNISLQCCVGLVSYRRLFCTTTLFLGLTTLQMQCITSRPAQHSSEMFTYVYFRMTHVRRPTYITIWRLTANSHGPTRWSCVVSGGVNWL